jgi:hypothetical protein
MSITNVFIDYMPGEEFFLNSLQKNLIFTIGSKTLKKGKLIIFKRQHYHIQLTLTNVKQEKENFEIPIPFAVEEHLNDNLVYFDYRMKSLAHRNSEAENKLNTFRFKSISPSQFFNNILEIQTFI